MDQRSLSQPSFRSGYEHEWQRDDGHEANPPCTIANAESEMYFAQPDVSGRVGLR